MDAEREAAYKEAAVELSKSIAIGFVPFLGQAIDIYDSLESAWRIYGAKEGNDAQSLEDAKFDMILALIGWIPGPGDGVKKSLRLVNKDPQRFAPILFDLLRKVLELCDIKTSPEALLAELFNAGKLKAQMEAIQSSIEDSDIYASLSQENQQRLKVVFTMVAAELPAMVGIVERRLLKWKKVQPNSSAQVHAHGKVSTDKPARQDGSIATAGRDRPAAGGANEQIRTNVATEVTRLVSDIAGVLGEHITDYHCAEKLGWGAGWQSHDLGPLGEWSGAAPSRERPGKLSNRTHLFQLGFGINGKGIDAVWRAEGHNEGKRYAIVEAKSEVDLLAQAPSWLKKNPNSPRKPAIASRLGVGGVPKAEELLEPYDDMPTGTTSTVEKGKKKRGANSSKSSATSTAPPLKSKPGPNEPRIMVQMSHEWVEKNIKAAVSPTISKDILTEGATVYARHIFFVAMWSESARQHAKAILDGQSEDGTVHTNHDLPINLHYREADVKAAVNKRKARLRKKYGDIATLKEEV